MESWSKLPEAVTELGLRLNVIAGYVDQRKKLDPELDEVMHKLAHVTRREAHISTSLGLLDERLGLFERRMIRRQDEIEEQVMLRLSEMQDQLKALGADIDRVKKAQKMMTEYPDPTLEVAPVTWTNPPEEYDPEAVD